MSLQTQSDKSQPGWKTLAMLLLLTLGGGGAIALLTRNQMDFYDTLNKPAFAPPGWLFPVVWTVLYIAMAVAIWLALRTGAPKRWNVLALYLVQLAVNLLWPVIFFIRHALGMAFVWLVLLWALVIILTVWLFRLSRPAGWLMVPYLAWITFAGVLNGFIARINA
ncbi:MAG: TspO/MBR family protein [Aristaeellaceae bacterium]